MIPPAVNSGSTVDVEEIRSAAVQCGFSLVKGSAAQDVVATRSRRAEPRRWVSVVADLVRAGLHPKASDTTVALARDLAGRMDYRRGIVLYDLAGTAERMSVSVATVKRHAAVLRELGLLVWLVHGSKRNLHVPGRAYTATATVYGAVIPPVVDAAMGHRLSGCGYEARVVGVSDLGRIRSVTRAQRRAVRRVASTTGRPVRRRAVREPHSLGRNPHSGKAEVGREVKDTERCRSEGSTPTPTMPRKRVDGFRRSPGPGGRGAAQVRRDIEVARQVRMQVGWTRPASPRRLAFALRPLIDQGLIVPDIIAELHSWYLGWIPRYPAAFIVQQLRTRGQHESPDLQTPVIDAHSDRICHGPGAVLGIVDTDVNQAGRETDLLSGATCEPLDCTDCGRPGPRGLCADCDNRRAVAATVTEYGWIVASRALRRDGGVDVTAVRSDAEVELRERLAAADRDAQSAGVRAAAGGVLARMMAQQTLRDAQQAALADAAVPPPVPSAARWRSAAPAGEDSAAGAGPAGVAALSAAQREYLLRVRAAAVRAERSASGEAALRSARLSWKDRIARLSGSAHDLVPVAGPFHTSDRNASSPADTGSPADRPQSEPGVPACC